MKKQTTDEQIHNEYAKVKEEIWTEGKDTGYAKALADVEEWLNSTTAYFEFHELKEALKQEISRLKGKNEEIFNNLCRPALGI